MAAVLLTRDLGFVAAVAAFSARMLVTIPAGAGVLARVAGLPVARQFRAVARPLLLGGAMALAVLAARTLALASGIPLVPRLAALTTGGALLYATLVWMFDRPGLARVAALRR